MKNTGDMDNSEMERIKQEVEKRLQRAEALGLKEMFTYLYFHKIEYYPCWIENEKNRKHVPVLITDAVETENNAGIKKIQLILKNRSYLISFEESSSYFDDDCSSYGKMMLYFDDKKVLDLSGSRPGATSQYDCTEWSFHSIKGFIDGNWVTDFKELEAASKESDKKNKEEYERKEKIDEAKSLKENFGIE